MIKNLVLLIASVLFALMLCEGGLRAIGRNISYAERSENKAYNSPYANLNAEELLTKPANKLIKDDKIEFAYSWQASSIGLRNKELAPKAKKRIMVLGDSFTQGIGAPNDSTYPILLEQMLRANDSTATFEVINCGIAGSDIFYSKRLLEKKLLQHQPDMVIYTLNTSDNLDCIVRGGFERFQPNGKVKFKEGPWFEKYYAKSFLVRFLVNDVLKYDHLYLSRKQRAQEEKIAVQKINTAIDSLSVMAQQHHFRLMLVTHPMYFEMEEKNYLLQPHINHCRQYNIPLADVRACMTAKGISPNNVFDVYWPKDQHFNSRGYHLLAQCVYEQLHQHIHQ